METVETKGGDTLFADQGENGIDLLGDAILFEEAGRTDAQDDDPEVTPLDICFGSQDGNWCDGHYLVTCLSGQETDRVHCHYGCLQTEPAAHECEDPPAPGFCGDKTDGNWCKGDSLATCSNGTELSVASCTYGCDPSLSDGAHECKGQPQAPDFCKDKMNGHWCNGDNLVKCKDDQVVEDFPCPNGCISMPLGTPDKCADASADFCEPVPAVQSPSPPTEACNWMDWKLSPDGFYLISQFGTTNDGTTMGNGTTCGYLQGHYDVHGCMYSNQTGSCVGDDYDIPWVQGHVDWDYGTVLDTVTANLGGDVPNPEFMYVAGAQRFGCGALLRVSNTENGRCVVVYTEDGGPGTTYEMAGKGGRRILDASPGVVKYLQCNKVGWLNSTLLYVEWPLPGDFPGKMCTPCQATPAKQGSEFKMPPYDVNHMMGTPCP